MLELLFTSLNFQQVREVKSLSRAWRAVARRVLTNSQWQASQLPLLQLLQFDIGYEAALARVRGFPAEASVKNEDEDARYPIHLACAGRASDGSFSVELVQALLDACPDSASKRDGLGLTPLHIAAEAAAPVPILEVRLPYIGSCGAGTNPGGAPPRV